ncbi:MAG TPA: ankyrin repeat domain-containing protein [Thermoleophilia bacterium]|nr:ankyrin repeat domain-containing protein [Thermoleophilia bacterium]
MRVPKAAVAALLLTASAAAAGPAPDARSAVERALPSLQRSAKAFVARRSCVSCHHNILPILTLRLAASRGIGIDAATLVEVERKTFRVLTNPRALDDAVQGSTVGDPTPNDSWLLVAAKASGLAPDLTQAVYAKRIASWQRAGHWTTSDFRPPHSSSLFTATATASLAIRSSLPDEMRSTRDRVLQDARAWLLSTPTQSTEDATFRLLGLVWTGAASGDVAAARRDLLNRQRPGGGWSELTGYPADAYSTGEALYALHDAGVPPTDAAWRRGVAFLLSSQAADGTWHVRTRMISPAQVSPPYFSTGFPYRKDEYISYAASAWAAMALLSGLPLAGSPATAPPPISEVPPASPQFRAAILESAARFASGFAGNASLNTPNGTSLLMAAAPDADKVKLLLARGAGASYRAPSGYDALTAAASYAGSAAVLGALLDAGASADPPAGTKATRWPLLFASMSGDLEAVSLLLAHGASVNLGPGPSGDMPISEAITFGRADVVRALISAGAGVHLVERTGVNLLHWAAITNRAEVIPVLAGAGVDIDAIDEAGYTPLMYAATIDFGETSTLQALLAAGATATIANGAGLTPLQQARRLGHLPIAAVLAGKP